MVVSYFSIDIEYINLIKVLLNSTSKAKSYNLVVLQLCHFDNNSHNILEGISLHPSKYDISFDEPFTNPMLLFWYID